MLKFCCALASSGHDGLPYESAGRSVSDVMTGYVLFDSSDSGALPGRSTTIA